MPTFYVGIAFFVYLELEIGIEQLDKIRLSTEASDFVNHLAPFKNPKCRYTHNSIFLRNRAIFVYI